MYSTTIDAITDEGLLYEEPPRSSDIQFPPAMNALLLAVWLICCAVGFGIVTFAKNPVVGAAVIVLPTFLGMLIRPTFALCILMLVLPTGAGVGWGTSFSLERAAGLVVAVSFILNVMLTRPGLRIRHRSLWIAGGLSLWIFLASLPQPYLAMEIGRAFTQFHETARQAPVALFGRHIAFDQREPVPAVHHDQTGGRHRVFIDWPGARLAKGPSLPLPLFFN